MKQEIIYLDHAATTPVSQKVLLAMMPYFSEKFFNPSAPYFQAIEVRRDYEDAKWQIARIIGGKSDEIIITAGATESINLAFSCLNNPDDEVLIGEFEHHSVLENAKKSKNFKFVKILPSGIIDVEDLKNKITPKTKLISVMLANNETGIIQPLSKIAEIVKEERNRRIQNNESNEIFFHTDASQGCGQIDVNIARLGVDMLTLNAGKIYGPKQVGLLWADRNINLSPIIVGGGQERNLRSGTENVAGVIGFAKALHLADKTRKSEIARLQNLKNIFKKILQENFTEDDFRFIGNPKKQLASHISLTFPEIDAERIVFSLENRGVLIATGSACAANKGTRSHVLKSMGLSDDEINGSLRISFGKISNEENTKKAAEIICEEIKKELERTKK